METLVNRFDHVEIATANIDALEKKLKTFGFYTTQIKQSPTVGQQKLMIQGQIRFLLTQGAPGTFADEYVKKHGDGMCTVAYDARYADQTLDLAIQRGARLKEKFSRIENTELSYARGAVEYIGDVRAAFVDREAKNFDRYDMDIPFAPGFEKIQQKNKNELGLLVIDHLTFNTHKGEMQKFVDFQKSVFGWDEVRYFDIRGEKTGLLSKVCQSPDGQVKVPVNEPTEEKSQIQEFLNTHKGPGVQHMALLTADIRKAVGELTRNKITFLKTPHTYYEKLKSRVNLLKEPVEDLERLGILADGDDKGYLLQIFTENQIGPFFFEAIERHNNNGFGEGNFTALFEAIEADQRRRGVI